MINFTKSQPAPPCLELEKAKANGDYKCGDVLQRLNTDFHKKCYICEDKDVTSSNVEHFMPHKGDKTLMFDWSNLFLACYHCNNTKLAVYSNLLNCIDATTVITDCIKFVTDGFPKAIPHFNALNTNVTTLNTVDLLVAVYNGTTPQKEMESSNLRDKLSKEVKQFNDLLYEYFFEALDLEEKADLKKRIKRRLSVESSFTAFKVWIIKEKPIYMREFGDLLPKF